MNKNQKNTCEAHRNEPHAEDDCQGCQKQRKQNNNLVNFYERLNHIESKVGKMKDNVMSQQQIGKQLKNRLGQMNNILKNKPEESIKSIQQQNSKQMGYELASILIEKEIKSRIENKKLQQIIEKLTKDKKKLEEEKNQQQSRFAATRQFKEDHLVVNRKSTSRYSDILDEVHKSSTNTNESYFQDKKQNKNKNSFFVEEDNGKRYWEEFSDKHQQTNFSHFSAPITRSKILSHKSDISEKIDKPHEYNGINLWLYQFKTQDMEDKTFKLNQKTSKTKQKVLKISQNKYQSKF